MTVFRHGVASGDPLQDRVVLWTRISTDDRAAIPVSWWLARDPEGTDVVAGGETRATAEADHTVHVDVGGLSSGTRYWYGFEAAGERSPVGRTLTLPDGHVERLRFAQCSCAKFNSGFFNAYGRIADRDDLAFVLHLGDYIYEASQTPPASQTPGADIGRPFEPRNECVTLADYRTRYAQYHADPDTRRMHAAHPIIATVDDHEFADGAWRGGSDEHKPDRDGSWEDRKAAAFRARWEWTPSRPPDPADLTRVFRSMRIGDLVELILIDTRSRRDQTARFEEMAKPTRSQLGAEQAAWLHEALGRHDTRWIVLGNGSVLSPLWRDGFPDAVLPGLLALKLVHKDGKGPDTDQWDGYPAERASIVEAIGRRPGDVVVLSGDVHVGIAAELSADPYGDHRPVAVEFVTSSLTSQNLDDKMGWQPRTQSLGIEQELLSGWPHIQWLDLDSHGYVVIEVTPDRVSAQWWFVDSVLESTDGEWRAAEFMAERGRPKLVRVHWEQPAGGG